MKGPTIAIVSTVRSPGASFSKWVRWHRMLGIDRIYIFIDDDPVEIEKMRLAAEKGVEVVVVGRQLQSRMRRDPYCAQYAELMGDLARPIASPEELTTRQLCNTKFAIDQARADGMRWLLHIDLDELFLPPGLDAKAHFAKLDGLGMGYAIYDNHEALPEKEPCDDPFIEATLFKKNARVLDDHAIQAAQKYFSNRGGYFLAYANGKAAVRTMPGALPAGVHGFYLPPASELGRCRVSTPAILHYPYTGFDVYWRKFKRLGNWQSETMLGQKWWPPIFEMQSRDLAVADRKANARAFYKRAAVMSSKEKREVLLRAGVLARIQEPSRYLLTVL